jgi:hypothetical protein
MIYWRELLSSISVQWYDRGPNTSHGHITIQCPWCGSADPSHHLAIEEQTGAYYCYRNPRHGGRSPFWLVSGLGVHGKALEDLLKKHSSGPLTAPQKVQEKRGPEKRDYSFLLSADKSQTALSYLTSRGFSNPHEVIKDYRLRVASYGRLSWRLLFPINPEEDAFVGRALLPNLEPKYLSTSETSRIYQPREFQGGTLLITEGPFDALKCDVALSSVYGRDKGMAVALLGLSLASEKMAILVELIKRSSKTVIVLDRDQPVTRSLDIVKLLQMYSRNRASGIDIPIQCSQGPEGYEDLGDTPIEVIANWLRGYL